MMVIDFILHKGTYYDECLCSSASLIVCIGKLYMWKTFMLMLY